MKYSKNLLLLHLNLQKCCIGDHQAHLIATILERNRQYRYKQLKQLNETEHFVLHNQNMLLKSTGQKLAGSQDNLSHVQSELEKLEIYKNMKYEVHKTRAEILDAERRRVK